VSPASNRDLERLLPGTGDCCGDISRGSTARDERRSLVDEAVVKAASLVVASVVRPQDLKVVVAHVLIVMEGRVTCVSAT